MAVAYRAGATANDGQSATTASAPVTIPTSGTGGTVVAGDTAVFCMSQNSGTSAFTPPAGWVLKRGPETINSNLRAAVWAKDIDPGEPGTVVTFTSSVGARLPGTMVVLSGTSAAALTVEMATLTTASTTVTSPPIATSVDGTGIVGFWVLRDATASPAPTVTVPASHTAGSVSKTAFGASPNFTVASSYRTTPGAAGTYGSTTATATEASTAIVFYVAAPPTLGAPPVASFTRTPATGAAPLAITFTDTSTGTPTAWAWDFGDGDTATVQNPVHTYESAGTYTVSMSATNAGGADAAATSTVTVSPAAPGGGLHLFRLEAGVYEPLTPYTLTP